VHRHWHVQLHAHVCIRLRVHDLLRRHEDACGRSSAADNFGTRGERSGGWPKRKGERMEDDSNGGGGDGWLWAVQSDTRAV
jgi:hypothetical protein